MKTLLKYILVYALLSTVSLSGYQLAYASGGISITSEEVISQFPDGIRFVVTATGPNTIEDIKITYRIEGGETNSYGYIDMLEEGTGEYLLRASGGSFIPPGTPFHYIIEVFDDAGAILRTEEKQVLYMDTRFEWSSITNNPITVHYYGPTESRAKTILEASNKTIEHMKDVLGIEDVDPINVVAYNNSRHMSSALPPKPAAIAEDLITEGQAWPDKRVVLVMAFPADVEGIGSHEITHVLVGDAAGIAYPMVPTWLNEGLAEYGNQTPSRSYEQALRYGIFTRKLKPLWFLNTFSGEPNDVIIAYGQASAVIEFMIGQFGTGKIAELMMELQNTLDIDDALKNVYGFDSHGLDSKWRESLGLKPFPSPTELGRQMQEQVVTPEGTDSATSGQSIQESSTDEPITPAQKTGATSCTIQQTSNNTQLPVDFIFFGIIGMPLTLLSFRRIKKWLMRL